MYPTYFLLYINSILGISMFFIWNLRPILVPARNDEIDTEVDKAHQRKKQEKQIEMISVNIVPCQPSFTASDFLGGMIHTLHHYSTQKISKSH